MSRGKIKILMGIPSKGIKMGGPTTHLKYLVEYFKEKQEFDICTFAYGSKIDGGSLTNGKEGVLNKIINTTKIFLLFTFLVLFKYRPHIIHLNTAFDKNSLFRDVPFSLFAFIFRKKLIFKIHGSSKELVQTNSKVYLFLIRLFFLGADRVGVLSAIERGEFISHFRNPEKILVVKNIVVQNKIGEVSYNEVFKREHSKKYGLFISRIVTGKGLDYLIQALPMIKKNLPEFCLLVVGDGPQKEACEKLAIEHKIDNAIKWLGYIKHDDLPGLFELSDIFIFPSQLPEGMPMALLDAMKHEIPIVTSKVRFARDYMKADINCVFIDPKDKNELSVKVFELMQDPELQNRMKKENLELIKQFDRALVGREFESVYRKMLESKLSYK